MKPDKLTPSQKFAIERQGRVIHGPEKAMQLAVHEDHGVTVLAPQGQITMGDAVLRKAVDVLVNDGICNIVIDLGGVTFIDSFGVGQLIACYTMVTDQGGRLILCGLSPRISSILQITKLSTVFEVYPNEAEAMDSF